MSDDDAEREEMLALAREYAQRLPSLVAEMTDALGAVRGGTGVAADFEMIAAVAHRIAGSAGMFGFRALSTCARETERLAKTGAADKTLASAEHLLDLAASPGDPDV